MILLKLVRRGFDSLRLHMNVTKKELETRLLVYLSVDYNWSRVSQNIDEVICRSLQRQHLPKILFISRFGNILHTSHNYTTKEIRDISSYLKEDIWTKLLTRKCLAH